MANQRDLLKEAIADAKAVKETAIANAKASLEESFTPHLKSMLSAKLQEMEEDDDLDEGYGKKDMDEAKKEEVEEEKKEEIEEETLDLDELEEGKDEMDEAKDQMDEAEEEEEEDSEMEGEDTEMDEEEIDLEDMSEEDLKNFIEDVISDMVESGELEPGEEAEMESEEEEMEDEIEMEDDSEEEIMEKEDMEEGKEEMEEGQFSGDQSDVPDLSGIISMVKKSPEMAKKLMNIIKELPAGAGYAMRREGESENLQEAISTINSLKSELQEINLLNAKLLYTNKIFKSRNLTEGKKLKVLKSFDKAETVKEAKMVFETLVDSLGSTKKSSMVNEIKSSASKASGITENTNKQPIMENSAFERMKKLAFHNSNI